MQLRDSIMNAKLLALTSSEDSVPTSFQTTIEHWDLESNLQKIHQLDQDEEKLL